MGDMADDAYRESTVVEELDWLNHRLNRCGGVLAYCPYCVENEIDKLEVEHAFSSVIATGGNHKT